MRLLLGCILVAGQCLVSCSNGHENTSKLNAKYVGDAQLKATFHNNRIYVVSERQDLKQVQLSNGGFVTSLQSTTQTNSNRRAWASDSIIPSSDQQVSIIVLTYKSKLIYGYRFHEKNGQWTLEATSTSSETVPTFPLVPGNQVDVTSFLAAFNLYRTRYGLPAVKYSHRLSVDAARNNNLQQRYGLGHHHMGSTSAQNSAMGYGSIQAAIQGWHNSSGHRINMQGRRWRCMGIHWQGRYWTQNFSAWGQCQ